MADHTTAAHSKSSPLMLYFGIWATLLILTFVTYEVAYLELGPFNSVVALVIATIKATLVALFFMHVWHAGEKLTKMVILGAVFFLLLLLGLTMADYISRPWS
jgi:cytochrome c oxidase subunit IV